MKERSLVPFKGTYGHSAVRFAVQYRASQTLCLTFTSPGAPTRPPAVSEDLFLRLKALFESLIVKGLDFRAEFDKFDDSFSGNREASMLEVHSCVCGADAVSCVVLILMLSTTSCLFRVRHPVRLQGCPAGAVQGRAHCQGPAGPRGNLQRQRGP
jgi:hypothetical protein